MSSSGAEKLEWLFRPLPPDSGIDRKALAGLLVELARAVGPDASVRPVGVSVVDTQLEQLRTLLVGHEIEVLERLREVVEDPERLGVAGGRGFAAAVGVSRRAAGQGVTAG